MQIDREAILQAKEKLGDRNAQIIVEELGITDFDEKNMKCCCPFHQEDHASFMNLPMNLNDIDLWEKELLKGFALPLGFLPEIGEVVNILEPFKRLTIFEPVEKDGETTEKKVTVGIIYRSDGLYAWDNSRAIPNEYDEAIKWSPASQLPEYAIRRKAIVTKFEYKPLRSFTADDIKLLRLDYASQDDPQLLMEEYLPIKNFELLYGWWKQHYKATLKDCDNPQAIILHLASTD